MNRRNFLKGLAASIGVAAVVPFVQAPEAAKAESQTVVPPAAPAGHSSYFLSSGYFFSSEAWEYANKRAFPKFNGPVYFESVQQDVPSESYEWDFDSGDDV